MAPKLRKGLSALAKRGLVTSIPDMVKALLVGIVVKESCV